MSIKKKTSTQGMWITPTGSYYTRLRRDDGKARWVSLGDDFKSARNKMRDYQKGAPVFEKVRLEEATKDWLAIFIATRRTENGQKLAKLRAERYALKFFTPDLLLEKLTGDHIRQYRVWLEKQPRNSKREKRVKDAPPDETKRLSPNTVGHLLSDFRALLNWCVDSGRIPSSPFPRRVMPRIQEALPKGLSDDAVAKLTALPEPYGFVWRLLVGTGLRWSEACNARTDHVRDGQLEVEFTKGKRVRRIPLSDELLAEIRGRVGLLVPFASTSPGSFARTCGKLAEVTGANVHRTRHTYAMRWVADRGSLAALQEVLGHSDLKLTQRYARVTEDLVRAEAKRIDQKRSERAG
jgi:integrase